MRECPHCKIKVLGNGKACPLCQNPLQGEPEEEYWPAAKQTKKSSLFLKLVWFIYIAAGLTCLALDFLVGGFAHYHWSLVVTIWGFSVIFCMILIIRHHRNLPRLLFLILFYYGVLVALTGSYLGVQEISLNYIIPIMCCATLSLNFLFSFFDAGFMDNSLVYILLNIVVGIVPYVVLAIHDHGEAPILWVISLLLSIITFAGLLIFKGRSVWVELQKRLHI